MNENIQPNIDKNTQTSYPKGGQRINRNGGIFMAELSDDEARSIGAGKTAKRSEEAERKKQEEKKPEQKRQEPQAAGGVNNQTQEKRDIPEATPNQKTPEKTEVDNGKPQEVKTEELEKAYLDLVIRARDLERDAVSFGEKEAAAQKLSEATREVIQQLEERGVDVGDLFKKAAKEAGREGERLRSVGAASPMDDATFNLEADRLKGATTRQDLKNQLDLAKATPRGEMPQFWKQFIDFSQKLNERLYDEYSIQPDTAEGIRRKAELNAEISTLRVEQGHVLRLIENRVPDLKQVSQEQQRLIDEITQKRKNLVTAPAADTDRIEKEISEAANDLYQILLDRDRPPEDQSIPDEVLEAIGADELATEKLINRLIFMPIENEQHHMSGFYSQSNLDKFLKINNEAKIGRERSDRLRNLEEANKTFHNMNYIVKRSFDQFAQQAQSILPDQFEVLSKIAGVSTVFHLYERFAQEHLGIETRITSREFDDRENPRNMDREVKAALEELNKANILKGMEGDSLAEWEIERALTYGRNMFRITVRAPEYISRSELQEGSEVYVSPPLKALSNIVNFIKFTIYRFKPNKELGGYELIQNVKNRKMEERQKRGQVRLKTLQGTDVDMRTLENIIGARGYMYTWRMRDALLKEIKFTEEVVDRKTKAKETRVTNVTDFFTDHKHEIAAIRNEADALRICKPLLDGNNLALGVMVSGWGENVPSEVKELLWRRIAEYDPLVMANLLTRLRVDSKAKNASGLMGKNGVKSLEEILLDVWGTDEQKKEDGPDSLRTGRLQKLRDELGESNKKLTRLDIEISRMKHEYIEKHKCKDYEAEAALGNNPRYEALLDQRTEAAKKSDAAKNESSEPERQIRDLLRHYKWETLKNKLTILHEKRILEETERIRDPKKTGQKPKSMEDRLAEAGIVGEELEVYNKIKENGVKIASDLAHFRTSTTWFMDDTPFPLVKWANIGQTYDRMVNDLGAFQKSSEAAGKIFGGRPFNEPPVKIAEYLGEAIAAEGDVVGRAGAAQDAYYDVFKEYLRMIYQNPRHRWLLVSEWKRTRREPTSRAQEITGSMQSPAPNETGLFEVVEHGLDANIVRKTVISADHDDYGKVEYEGQVEELEHEFKIRWFDRIIKQNLKDLGPVGIFALLISFLKETFSDLKR